MIARKSGRLVRGIEGRSRLANITPDAARRDLASPRDVDLLLGSVHPEIFTRRDHGSNSACRVR